MTTPEAPVPASAPRYAFFEGEWHRIAVGARVIPGFSNLTPAVTGCGLRLPEGVSVSDTVPATPRCGCVGKDTP